MADRIPLIVNPSVKQIQELPAQDKVLLSGHLEFNSNNASCGDIISTGGNDSVFGLYCSTSSNDSSIISIVGRNNAGNGNITIADFVVGASDAPQLNCKGDITAFASSDKRLKDNITPIPDALNKVLSISGNTFNWNEGSPYEGKSDTGVIAQEIETLDLPGVTTIRDDGTHAVKYERLVHLLIEAIKELSAKVDNLEALAHPKPTGKTQKKNEDRLDALEGKIKTLEG